MVDITLYVLAASLSFGFASLIVYTQHIHGGLTADSLPGIQKLHASPVPRVGGLAVVIIGGLSGFALPVEAQALWWTICASALPAFLFGLAEDVTKRVGALARLLATVFAGGLFAILAHVQITHADIPGVDWLLSFWVISFAITAIAIGGVANAFNIIDGVNGLASGTAIVTFLGLAVVAFNTSDIELATVSLLCASLVFGFFLMNFPFGKIFLGDAGAYTVGFVLAVIAIALPQRNPEISPLMSLVAVSYPVIETFVSIHRRMVRSGSHPGRPDRLHLHSLVYRDLARRIAALLGMPKLRNGIAGLIVLIIPAASSIALPFVANSAVLSAIGVGAVLICYLALYRRVALLSRTRLAKAAGQISDTKLRATLVENKPVLGVVGYRADWPQRANLHMTAGSDAVSAVLNRSQGQSLLGQLMAAEGKLPPFGAYRIFLNDFNWISENYGHSQADLVLRRLTRLLKATLNVDDALIRWGSEELLLVKFFHDGQDPSVYAEFILSLLRGDAQFMAMGITFSIGYGTPSPNEAVDVMIKRMEKTLVSSQRDVKATLVS